MPRGFVKLYGTILDSSIWSEDPYTRLVWITMLAMADAEGFVEAAVPGLARRANVPLDACEAALVRLQAPDPYSKSPENEGRRIEALERGWRILNYLAYRELRTSEQSANAERQKRYRERRTVTSNASNARETQVSASLSVSVEKERTDDAGEALLRQSRVARERQFFAAVKELADLLPTTDPAEIARTITSYKNKDGRTVGGTPRPELLSDARLDKSLEDARGWKEDLLAGK
jgi:hypothetical protein